MNITLMSDVYAVCFPCVCICVFFFFSSRRRHTRFDCDWSSDVCFSDIMIRHTRFDCDWSSDVCSSDLELLSGQLPSDARSTTVQPSGRRATSQRPATEMIWLVEKLTVHPERTPSDRKSVV